MKTVLVWIMLYQSLISRLIFRIGITVCFIAILIHAHKIDREIFSIEKLNSSIQFTDSLIQEIEFRREETMKIQLNIWSIERNESNSRDWDRADSSCNALLDSDYKLLVQLEADKRWLEWKKQILLESNKGGGE